MTDCDQVLREIEQYIDHELDASMCRDIEEHLAGCGPCLQRKEFKMSLRAIVAKKCGTGAAPDELLDRIRALLGRESPG